jgi:hypothetical protein
VKTHQQHATAEACHAQTLIIEAVENLNVYEFQNLEEASALFSTAIAKLVAANSAVREAIRERDGVPTIESTRRAG